MIASKLLYVLLVFGIALFGLSLVWPVFVYIGLLFDAVLILLVVIDFGLTQGAELLSAKRSTAERFSIGRNNEVVLEVFNQGKQNLKCLVRDDFPRQFQSNVNEFEFLLNQNAVATLVYSLVPHTRGEYTFNNINIRYLSLLQLIWRELKVPAKRSVKVYSNLEALEKLSIKLSHSSEIGELSLRKRGHGTEFASLREYISGDDTRGIDWKATARHNRPLVRVYEVEQEQTLMILVDGGRVMLSNLEDLSRFDHALNSALALALAGLYRNDRVSFGVFADKPILYMPPRRGKEHLTRILDAVYDVQPKPVESDYLGALTFFASAHKSRSLVVVLTDLTDPTGSQILLAGLASLSPRHLPLCVTLRDRQVDKIAHNVGSNIDDIYKRAVALDFIAQRELAFSHLARRGCLVLDCPPQELSEKLVDRYLEIKARGAL